MADGLARGVSCLVDIAVKLNLKSQPSSEVLERASTHIDRDVVSGEFPWVKVKPVVRNLDLITIDNLLLEDAIAITQAVTPGRIIQARKTVQEASSKSTQASVAQRGVVLLLDDILDPEPKVRQTS